MPTKFLPSSMASSLCHACETRLLLGKSRQLTTSTSLRAPANPEDAFANVLRSRKTTRFSESTARPTLSSISPPRQQPRPRRAGAAGEAAGGATTAPAPPATKYSTNLSQIFSIAQLEANSRPTTISAIPDSHHLHVYATKHNTHITFTRPNREPLLSVSAGNIGFKKAHRGTFDAAYQLSSYAMGKIQEQGHTQNMERLEVILRGYGPGREAFQKALLGSEGRGIKGKVTRVTDSTRLKFGGTRSSNVRRL